MKLLRNGEVSSVEEQHDKNVKVGGSTPSPRAQIMKGELSWLKKQQKRQLKKQLKKQLKNNLAFSHGVKPLVTEGLFT